MTAEQDKPQATAAPVPQPAPPPTRRLGSWEKAEIIGKIMTGLLPAIFVAALGLFGQQFAQSLEDNRLYTELLTQREQSDTALRKDMFKVLLAEFLAPSRTADASIGAAGGVAETLAAVRSISSQLLKLELLAMNFSDSLSLSPLFLKLDRELDQLAARLGDFPDDQEDGELLGSMEWQVVALEKRLEKLASRLSKQQIAAIKSGKTLTFDLNIPLEVAGGDDGFLWPDDLFADEGENGAGDEAFESSDTLIEANSVRDCQDVIRRFEFRFTMPDKVKRTVRVELNIEKIAASGTNGQSGDPFNPSTVTQDFELDFFNFPMVDNTRLSDDQRFALILTDFDERYITATALCFPGTYSSVRDRPFLNEVIEGLLD
ncbi:MAG: hypothetical protein AAF495_09260 [Pseudomonadota bacterium]